jgi:hypothetical protein
MLALFPGRQPSIGLKAPIYGSSCCCKFQRARYQSFFVSFVGEKAPGGDFSKETLSDDLEVGRETRERNIWLIYLKYSQFFFFLNYVVPARLRQYMG